MYKQMILTMSVLIFILGLGVCADARDFPNFSAQQIKAMQDQGKDMFLLCPLSDIVFNEKNIPGSANIQLKKIMKTDKLPKDKDALLIYYCGGAK